jgi:hypothetical protein
VHHAPFRLLRTTAVGTTILGLAAWAHVAAGGALPSPAIMAALTALHILCSTVATSFRLRLPAMTVLLATSQLVLHQAFESLSISAPLAEVPAGALNSMHHGMPADFPMLPDMGATQLAGTAMAAHAAMPGWMVVAHVAATLATAVLLTQGESALWALAGWLRPLYRAAAVVLVLPARQERPAVPPSPLPRLPWRNVRPNTRRGPPQATALFA